jgi:hypothetical protein
MVVIVAIVVAKHSTIIRSTNSRIDVSQNVLHDLAFICLPDFFLEYCALSFPFKPVRRINSLGDLQLSRLLSHPVNSSTGGHSESTPAAKIFTAGPLARDNGLIQVPTGYAAPSAPDQFDSMGNYSAE